MAKGLSVFVNLFNYRILMFIEFGFMSVMSSVQVGIGLGSLIKHFQFTIELGL